ncbi:MAG TPA: heme-binding protein [Bacillota bacterium]
MGFIHKQSISHEFAQKMISEAINRAEQFGIAVNVAVVDDGGHLTAFSRMDRAAILSIDIAINKAYTASAFGIPTHEWYELINDHEALKTGIVHTDRLVVFGGGYPIMNGNDLAGGIGVSGGTEEEDQQCCQAALKLLENTAMRGNC